MRIKQMLITEYQIAREWFQNHWGFDFYDALPTTGFMSFEDAIPIAALFFYQSRNSNTGLISWLVSNPSSSSEQREEAFSSLFAHVEDYAKNSGYKYLVGLTGMHAIGKRFEQAGYTFGDEVCRQFTKKIGA